MHTALTQRVTKPCAHSRQLAAVSPGSLAGSCFMSEKCTACPRYKPHSQGRAPDTGAVIEAFHPSGASFSCAAVAWSSFVCRFIVHSAIAPVRERCRPTRRCSRRATRCARGTRLSWGVSAPRKAWRIWSGESPGMVRVNHPPLPSVAPLAERCLGRGDWGMREQER